MNRFRKYMALDRATRRRMLYAAILQGITRFLLGILPFGTFKKVYGRWAAKGPAGSDTRAEQQVYAVSTTGRYLKSTCLVQALVLKHLVSDSRLVIGVTGGKAFEAHAWVERNGAIILGEVRETRFTPIWIWE